MASLGVEWLAGQRKRCGGCVLGCCEQLCVEAKPVLAYFRKPSFCPRLIQNLLHGSVSAPEACIWRRVLGVIKNQYFCRRNLRAAARATDRFTVRGPALLVTSGHLRPRYREISSSGAHRAEISTSSGPRTFWRGARGAAARGPAPARRGVRGDPTSHADAPVAVPSHN